MKQFFVPAVFLDLFKGGRLFGAWIGVLIVGVLVGASAYVIQLREGLIVTNMTDEVSWGLYIGNFTVGVGIAAAAVMVVIPAYVYRLHSFKEIMFIGEILALSAVFSCLLFVTVDLGRPDRAWHLIPFFGSLNFPTSILAWDVIVLAGYLVINFVLIVSAFRSKYYGREPIRAYVPLVMVSMVWAITIHTVTAFLYTWLGARPYWNSAIIAPRFIVSAFLSGPAILVLVLRVVQRFSDFVVQPEVFRIFRRIITTTLLINMFLFGSEVFTEMYGGSKHAASMYYLLFGHHEHVGLRIPIWFAITLEVLSALILLSPVHRRPAWFNVACVGSIVGVWIEKGMALILPGFVPTPLGQFVEYQPSSIELLITVGIVSFGALLFTVLVNMGIRIETGALKSPHLASVDQEAGSEQSQVGDPS